MTSNGKMLTAVARDQSVQLMSLESQSVFQTLRFCNLFCYITNHLMTGPKGNSEFCFPRISMFPSSRTTSRKTLRFERNEIHCSPREPNPSPIEFAPTEFARMINFIFQAHLHFQWIIKERELQCCLCHNVVLKISSTSVNNC